MTIAAAAPPTLTAERWQHRVLLVFAADRADPHFAAQERALAHDPAGLGARDLLVVRIVGDHVDGLADRAATLRRSYDVPAGGFAFRLIGKDGHVALSRGKPIALPDLFATIDAMPMRRDEMRRRR